MDTETEQWKIVEWCVGGSWWVGWGQRNGGQGARDSQTVGPGAMSFVTDGAAEPGAREASCAGTNTEGSSCDVGGFGSVLLLQTHSD